MPLEWDKKRGVVVAGYTGRPSKGPWYKVDYWASYHNIDGSATFNPELSFYDPSSRESTSTINSNMWVKRWAHPELDPKSYCSEIPTGSGHVMAENALRTAWFVRAWLGCQVFRRVSMSTDLNLD